MKTFHAPNRTANLPHMRMVLAFVVIWTSAPFALRRILLAYTLENSHVLLTGPVPEPIQDGNRPVACRRYKGRAGAIPGGLCFSRKAKAPVVTEASVEGARSGFWWQVPVGVVGFRHGSPPEDPSQASPERPCAQFRRLRPDQRGGGHPPHGRERTHVRGIRSAGLERRGATARHLRETRPQDRGARYSHGGSARPAQIPMPADRALSSSAM